MSITRCARYDAEGTGYAPHGSIMCEGHAVTIAESTDLLGLIEVMAVCNDAHVVEEDGHWKVVGEPTEGALRTLALKAAFND